MKSFLLLVLMTGIGYSQEQVLDFHSRIQILENGNLHVVEKIKVVAENRRIKHGIYRSTPTVYFGVFFTHRNSNVVLVNTKLDGKNVEYHKERLVNGVRVYLGSKDSYVSRGVHTYEIEYISERQVVDLKDSDGLYWNVNGNDWGFQIKKASADIYFPRLTNVIKHDAWTGYYGNKNQDFSTEIYDDHIHFETTKPLYSKQGISVQVTWPKGLIGGKESKVWFFIKDNVFWFLSIIMLILFPLYFYITWKRVGVDPAKSPIFPRFEPPSGLSAAATRYISKNYFDGKAFSSAVMSMAVKQYISIKQNSKSNFTFTKLGKSSLKGLSKGELKTYNKLFSVANSIVIKKKYNAKIKSAFNTLNSTLKYEYKDVCYRDNNGLWIVGVVLSCFALLFNWGHFFNFAGYAVSFLIAPIAAIILSAVGLINSNKAMMKIVAVVLPASVLTILLMAQEDKVYIAYLIVIIVILIINGTFFYLIQSPTVFGRKLLDKISGFKMYLTTAEQDRLELLHPPEMTPELFEKYLPYALALGVENSWSEQFDKAMRIQGKDASSYHPSWYVGNSYSNFNISSTASTIGAGLASSVVSASTPPSQSGGSFGGGGFSGGGGGGGGGGGW